MISNHLSDFSEMLDRQATLREAEQAKELDALTTQTAIFNPRALTHPQLIEMLLHCSQYDHRPRFNQQWQIALTKCKAELLRRLDSSH